MAKNKSPAATRDLLLADGRAKINAAEAALTAAQQEFEAAGNPDDKAKAQQAITAASADIENYSKVLKGLAGGKAATEAREPAEPKTYVAMATIKHDGQVYEPGEDITLPQEAADALPPGSLV